MHSPREHFHSYLHSLDVEREALPESVPRRGWRGAAALRRRRTWSPVPTLEEAVYRVFLAQQRAADQMPVVAALLERWLTRAATVDRAGRATRSARSSTGWSSRPSCATRRSATWPAASGSGYFERAADPAGPRGRSTSESASSSPQLDERPATATERRAADRGAGREPRAADPAAGRAARRPAAPARSRCSRC